jgi:hypothetical protein
MDTAGSHHIWDSAAFWPAAGIVVGLLAIAATVWVTLRAANPKRRLYYAWLTDTPLITRQHDLSEELKVTYGARQLVKPRIVTVQLVSRGRRDIAREAFDDGKPVCLDLSTPIVQCVKVTTSPPDRPDPSYALDGSKLLIGPGHFGKRQTTVFSLLLDGKTPEIVRPQQSLIDVEIRQGDGQTLFTSPTWWLFIPVFVALTVVPLVTSATAPGQAAAEAAAVVAVVAAGTLAVLAFYRVGPLRRLRD